MTSLRTLSVAAIAMLTAAGSANAADDHAAHMAAASSSSSSQMVHADLIGLDGKKVGMVMLQQAPAGVLVTADATGMPAGEHGFHFHQKGMCAPATKFESAGGHFAGGNMEHGYMTAKGPHGGDMPNQYVGTDGVLKAQVLNPGVTLGKGPKSLFDADGSALVIHAAADDYTSQPSGNAGGRLACAVIAKPR